jgi:hypothetical protein
VACKSGRREGRDERVEEGGTPRRPRSAHHEERKALLKKLLIALVAGAFVAVVAVSAATLIVDGGVIQTGTDFDLTCDDAVAVAGWGLETGTNTVHFVRVGNVDDVNCLGADLFVAVRDNGGGLIANSGAVPVIAGQQTYTLNFTAPFPEPQNIGSVQVWIEGA